MFAAAVGHRSGRAMPSLRDAPQQQSMEIVGRETIYRNRNAVQTNPATSQSSASAEALPQPATAQKTRGWRTSGQRRGGLDEWFRADFGCTLWVANRSIRPGR